jgi:NAD(P)-dependent dehydrogenase (short-subunit alcohol dehydrogenase family)
LAPGGRFLEIGKRDIYANTAIGLRLFRNNLSMHVIDMGQVMAKQPHIVQCLLQIIIKLIRAGELHPLPHQTLPVSEAASAFRLMAQAKHIGKIVLTVQGVRVTPKRLPPTKTMTFPANASYLITGGLGGFGLAVAKWLIESGAKSLVLTGRSGAATPEAKRAVAELKQLGAKVLVVKADVTDEKQVERIFKLAAQKLEPLRGIFHAAMVLDDGALPQLTAERFSSVMSPKVTGAWNLHTASKRLALDHFVMFSSVSALVGELFPRRAGAPSARLRAARADGELGRAKRSWLHCAQCRSCRTPYGTRSSRHHPDASDGNDGPPPAKRHNADRFHARRLAKAFGLGGFIVGTKVFRSRCGLGPGQLR